MTVAFKHIDYRHYKPTFDQSKPTRLMPTDEA